MTHLTSFLPSLCRLGLEAFFPFSFLDRVAPRASLTKSHRLLATQHVNSDRNLLRRQSSKPGMRHALSARNIARACVGRGASDLEVGKVVTWVVP